MEALFQAFCEGAERNPDDLSDDDDEAGGGGFFYDEDAALAGIASAALGVGDVDEVRSAGGASLWGWDARRCRRRAARAWLRGPGGMDGAVSCPSLGKPMRRQPCQTPSPAHPALPLQLVGADPSRFDDADEEEGDDDAGYEEHGGAGSAPHANGGC